MDSKQWLLADIAESLASIDTSLRHIVNNQVGYKMREPINDDKIDAIRRRKKDGK